MKRLTLVVLFALAMAGAVGAAVSHQDKPGQAKPQKPSEPNVAGKWAMSLEMSQGTATPALDLKQDGTKITGTYSGRYGTFPLEGIIKGRTIQFSFAMGTEGQPQTMSFAGEVSADAQAMKGTASLGEMGEATWTAKRQ